MCSFTYCISQTNNTQIDNVKNIDILMPTYNLIEYGDNYSKTSGSLWQYYKDVPAVKNNGNLVEFNSANVTHSLNFKSKRTGQTDNNGKIDNVEIMVPLKCLSNFLNFILTWSANCIIYYANVVNQNPTFEITETKLYVPVVTLSTQDNAKFLPQLKSGFKRTINWNKYLAKPELLAQNPNLNHMIEPSFQGVNRLFVSAFENHAQRASNKRYYLPNVKIKDYNVMIDGKNLLDQIVKNNQILYGNIRKTATGQGNDYTTACLLDYLCFKEKYKIIAMI